MTGIVFALVAALAMATIWPDLPFGRGVARLTIGAIEAMRSSGLQSKAVIGIALALLLFAAFWALNGDAPMVLALLLPELAAWFTTFEIATLAEALLGVGTVLITARAAGVRNYLKGRIRARRTRRTSAAARKPSNDDEPGALQLAA